MFKKVALLAVAGAALASNGAFAATATDTMNVTANILGACSLVTNTQMDFGNIADTTIAGGTHNATGTMDVNCVVATPWDIGVSGTVGAREMLSPTLVPLGYEIFTSNTYTTPVDGPGGANVITGTGTGVVQNIGLFGRLKTQATPAADSYLDVVTVTLTY